MRQLNLDILFLTTVNIKISFIKSYKDSNK